MNNRRVTRWLWPLLLVAAILMFAPSTRSMPVGAAEPLTAATLASYFDAQIAQHMADDHIAGATVAVVQADEVLFADYIFIDVQMDETTIFRNCSGLEALVDEVPQ
jgi:hypothetical protein